MTRGVSSNSDEWTAIASREPFSREDGHAFAAASEALRRLKHSLPLPTKMYSFSLSWFLPPHEFLFASNDNNQRNHRSRKTVPGSSGHEILSVHMDGFSPSTSARYNQSSLSAFPTSRIRQKLAWTRLTMMTRELNLSGRLARTDPARR